jgi:hypothetical protein
MSPYEDRYIDVKFIGEASGSVTVAVEEGLPLPLCPLCVFSLIPIPFKHVYFDSNLDFSRFLCRFPAMAPCVSSIGICFTTFGSNC